MVGIEYRQNKQPLSRDEFWDPKNNLLPTLTSISCSCWQNPLIILLLKLEVENFLLLRTHDL